MATWIDLSAHNLALWRVGEDKNGKRRYVLLPVFSDVRHTKFDADGPIGKAFPWNPAVGGYVLNLRYAQEKLPAKDLWFAEFPCAQLRDRDVTTFPIHQPSVLRLHSLLLRHPWVWSNKETPERLYANEEQALSDGAGPAILREPEEVDMRGVRELVFPVESTALENDATEESLEASLPEKPEKDEKVSRPETANTALLADYDAQITEISPGLSASENNAQRRMDYGEHIPGARKSLWEGVQADLDVQTHLLETTGRYDPKAIQILANKMRRDAVWGTLEARLEQPDVAGSPLKQALWTWLYEATPASVKSVYWNGENFRGRGNKKNKKDIPEENLYLRVIAYPEILRSIERRIDLLDESLSEPEIAQQLTRLLSGDPIQGAPENSDVFTDLYPSGPYDRLPEALRDRALFIFPVSMNAYAELLDHPSYSLFNVVSALKKDNSSNLCGECIRSLLDRGLDVAPGTDTDDLLIQNLQNGFLTIKNLLVESRVNDDLAAVISYLNDEESSFLRGTGMRMVKKALGDAVTDDALENATPERMEQILNDYAKVRHDILEADFNRESAWTPSIIPRLIDVMNRAVADTAMYQENSRYREAKQSDMDSANQASVVIRHQLIVADNLRVSILQEGLMDADSAPDQVTSRETEESVGDVSAPITDDEPPHEPQFIKWHPGQKPLPPERSDEEGYRSGPDTPREGQDITEEDLCARFGLRAVQYGNWMTQKDRQEHLNAAFDGLHDIQQMMGLEDQKAIGLPKKQRGESFRQPLALALGARGRGGRAAAHYEPSLHVINMTKTKGAGSLLHEWTHAADWFSGAELTDGIIMAASHLSANPLQGANPIFEYVETLKHGTEGSRTKADHLKQVVESAREKVIPLISKAFISKEIQERLRDDLRYAFVKRAQFDLRSQYDLETDRIKSVSMVEDHRTVSREDLKQAGIRGEQEGIRIFEESLPKLVAATDKLLSRLEAAMRGDERSIRTAGMFEVSRQILVDPVYKQSGKSQRTWNYDGLGAKNWLRELMDLPPLAENAETQTGRAAVAKESPVDFVVKHWGMQVFSAYWKNMGGKILNHNPYTEAQRTLQGNSAFLSNAMTLDGKKVVDKPYWSAPHELLARSISSVGYDHLSSDGIENTYLTDAAPRRYSDSGYRADPDPQGREREAFAQQFFEQVVPYLRDTAQKAVESHYAECMPNEAARMVPVTGMDPVTGMEDDHRPSLACSRHDGCVA